MREEGSKRGKNGKKKIGRKVDREGGVWPERK